MQPLTFVSEKSDGYDTWFGFWLNPSLKLEFLFVVMDGSESKGVEAADDGTLGGGNAWCLLDTEKRDVDDDVVGGGGETGKKELLENSMDFWVGYTYDDRKGASPPDEDKDFIAPILLLLKDSVWFDEDEVVTGDDGIAEQEVIRAGRIEEEFSPIDVLRGFETTVIREKTDELFSELQVVSSSLWQYFGVLSETWVISFLFPSDEWTSCAAEVRRDENLLSVWLRADDAGSCEFASAIN